MHADLCIYARAALVVRLGSGFVVSFVSRQCRPAVTCDHVRTPHVTPLSRIGYRFAQVTTLTGAFVCACPEAVPQGGCAARSGRSGALMGCVTVAVILHNPSV